MSIGLHVQIHIGRPGLDGSLEQRLPFRFRPQLAFATGGDQAGGNGEYAFYIVHTQRHEIQADFGEVDRL